MLKTSTPSNVVVDECESSLHACQYEQCTFVGKNVQGLRLHIFRRHGIKNASTKNNSQLAYESQLFRGQQYTAAEHVLVDTACDGVEILNSPVVEYVETSIPSNVAVDECRNNPYACQHEQCTFVGKNALGLSLHKRRRHGTKKVSCIKNS